MRGRPLLELLLLVIVWGLLLVPLWAITRTPTDTKQAHAEPQESLTAWVQIRFSEAPIRFVLFSQDQPVWEEASPALDQEEPLELVWDEQGQGKLRLVADWDAPGRRATEVRVSLPVGTTRGVLLWSRDAALSEALFLR